MGLFSSDKYTITTPNLSFYYPQKKLPYGKSNKVKKYYFDQLITKDMISNKYEGKSNLENMISLITTMNFFHTPAFVPSRTNYCGYLQKKTLEVNKEKFKKIFPDMKEILSTSDTNPSLEKNVILSLALKEYSFNYDKYTFIKDDIVYLIDIDKHKAYAINRVPKPTESANIFDYPRLLEPPLEPYELDLKKDLNIDLDIDNILEEVVLKPLRDNLKEKHNIDYYDESKKVDEESLHIDIIDKEKDFTTIRVSAEYTCIGMMRSMEEIKKEFLNNLSSKKLPKGILDILLQSLEDDLNIPIEEHYREFRLKYYNYAQSMITIKIPTYLITYLQRKEKDFDGIYIEYKDELGIKKLVYVADKYTITNEILKERLSAVYPIKGSGVPNGTKKLGIEEPKEHKYWRLALERAKYKKRWKLKYTKKEKEDKDIIEQFNNNGDTKYAEIYQCVNLLGATIKENRSNRFYIQYLKAVLKYFDKLCGGFPAYNEIEPVYSIRELTEEEEKDYGRSGKLPNGAYRIGAKAVTHYGEHHTRVEYEPIYGIRYLKGYRTKSKVFNTPLPAREDKRRTNIAFRIAGVKRYVANKTFKKECFTGVEPNVSGLYIYINVKDFSKSSVEEQNQGIYHGYTQYGLNLDVFFNAYNGIAINLKFKDATAKALVARSSKDFTSPVPVMFNLDIKKYEKENGHQWFNDGSRTINASAFEWSKTEYYYTGSLDNQKRRSRTTGWKRKFEYDDRCDFNPIAKPEHLVYFTAYLPLMPIKLWYKIPLSAKKEIAHSTILVYSYTSVEIKEKASWGKALTAIGAVLLGTFGGPLGFVLGNLSLATLAGVFKGKLALAINLASTIYGSYLGTTGGIEKGGMWGNLQTAGSIVGGTSGVFSAVNNYNMQNLANQFNSTMNDLANQHKSEADKLLEKELRGNRVNLTDYDVNTNYDETIEWLYYVAYGNVLYNDFYNKQAYNSRFKIYDEYDRFK